MNQNYIIFWFVQILEFVVMTNGEYKDRTDVNQFEQANPSDMGSYSHLARQNIHLQSGRQRHDKQGLHDDSEIEETVVKITVQVDRTDPFRHHQLVSGDLLINSIPQEDFGSVETLIESNEAGSYIQVMETTTKYRKQECVCPNFDDSAVMVYIKRIVGSLLNQMGVKNHFFGPHETITIDLQGEISYESFMALRKFVDSHDDDDGENRLQRVVEIMSGLLHTVHTFNYQPVSSFEYMKEKIVFHIPYLTTTKFWLALFSITLIGFVTLILCYQMLCARKYPLQFLFYVFLVFAVFSCIWIYAEMQESEKAENEARLEQYDTIPKDCNYNNLSRWESIQYFMRVKIMRYEDQCIQYYKQRSIDPFYRTTPVVAISETMARFIFHPLEYIGGRIGKFLNALTDAVPLWMRPFLLLLFIFGFLGIFSYRIRMPFISVEPVPRSLFLVPNQHTAVLENFTRQIVPLLRLDVSTDTDDLEEYILSQINPEEPVFSRSRHVGGLFPSSGRWLSSLHNFCNTSLQCFVSFSHLILLLITKLLRDTPTLSNVSNFCDNDVLKEIWDSHHNEIKINSESPEPILISSDPTLEADPIEIQLQEAAVEEPQPFVPTTSSSPIKLWKGKRRSEITLDSAVDDNIMELNDELLEGEILS